MVTIWRQSSSPRVSLPPHHNTLNQLHSNGGADPCARISRGASLPKTGFVCPPPYPQQWVRVHCTLFTPMSCHWTELLSLLHLRFTSITFFMFRGRVAILVLCHVSHIRLWRRWWWWWMTMDVVHADLWTPNTRLNTNQKPHYQTVHFSYVTRLLFDVLTVIDKRGSSSFDGQERSSNFKGRTFSVCGPAIWNSLPPDVRTIDYSFRWSLKAHLFRKAVKINPT